ncbi:Echinoderm microtubule-associated protein-like 1 [Bagarius yarrelli]|uniref:Echinoderm microtubule-associated protein-like 1 n=2 Tax=Otophysi TaxID=186626 RepID=A0A556U7P1_BAGYA|nr:Echinoderm microtubule-associated protein-like 1 [Bagarius yarrelli]
MEVTDRLASLEQRVQMQEDEIQLLKSALADVVRRLNISEEQQAMLSRKGPTKARPMIAALPLKPTVHNGNILPKKSIIPLCPSGSKKHNTPATKGTVKRTSSSEQVGPVSRKEVGGEVKSNRTRTASAGSNSSTKRTSERSCSIIIRNVNNMLLLLDEGYVKMYLKGRPITMYMPKELVDTYCLEQKADLPPKKLKLDWVYGYRGRDCRSNLYLLPTGETVYFIASVVVLYNVDEQLQRHYTGHSDDIKCLAVHPDKITIATGQVAGTSLDGKQLAPHVRVWDSVSLNTLHVFGTGFFDRAVVCLSFSKSNGGSWLCVVDDSNDHVLSVWDWQQEERLAEVKKQEKPKFVLCVTFSENGDAITGDSSGNILVWGKGSNRISLAILGAHESSVFALCMLRDGTLISGGKDRKLTTWDRNYQKIHMVEVPDVFGPIRTIAEGKGETILIGTTKNYILLGNLNGEFTPITQGHTDELWGLAVHPKKLQFLTCGHDKLVSLWDSTSHQPLWTKTLEDAAQSAGFHPSGAIVAIGTQTGRWLVLNTETKDLVTVHTDGNEQLSVMRFAPDGNFLAIGSHDNYIYIYSVAENGRKYSRVGKCSGHSSFITHLDWSIDSQYLVSNSGDYEILYWIPSVCKQVVSMETIRDIQWATFTCTLGFHVFGLWPDGSDGTDINAVCSANDKRLLATGDDFGKVRLFTFPCSQSRAPSHVYGGHSSHVTNVNFLFDNSHLVSAGGKDMSVMQCEQSICQARASVMIYDDTSKKWVPIKPGQQGFSRINIYHNTANNTFRVVGVKLQDQQVVINYSIVKGLKYNQATPTFHQWRDARQVYGLNFASKEEATTFSTAMLFALNVLSSQDAAGPAGQRQNGPATEDTEAQRRQMMEQHQMQIERERRTSGSAVSTLQFKVSASQSNTSPTEYRQFRAHTLPSHPRFAPSPPSSSSCSSNSSQERESISHKKDSSHKKTQQFSQLSTSLPSAFSPVQSGGTLPSRNVRQIPLSPPTSRQTDSRDVNWTSAHNYGANSPSPQPLIPLNQLIHPATFTQSNANSQLEHYPFQTSFSKSASGPPLLPQYYNPDLFYPSNCKDIPSLCVQSHAHQPQFAASFCPENTPFSCSSVSTFETTPPVPQAATALSSGPSIPPGHPSMLSSTPPLHPPAPVPMAGPPAPPPPPGPPPPAAAPPPNPPPLPAPSGLAAALAGAKLRKVQRPEESSAGVGSAKNDASRSSGGSGGGGEGLMQEMNALLARRLRAVGADGESGEFDRMKQASFITTQ